MDNIIASMKQDLGTTCEDVVKYFRNNKIQGELNSECNCPVANYIKSIEPSAIGFIEVSPIRLTINYKGYHIYHLPSNVIEFIMRFDIGDYKDLIEG